MLNSAAIMCGHNYALVCAIVALALVAATHGKPGKPVFAEDFEHVNEATSGWFKSPYMKLARGQGTNGSNALRTTLQPSKQGKRVRRKRRTVCMQARIGWDTKYHCRRDYLNAHCFMTSTSKAILRCPP